MTPTEERELLEKLFQYTPQAEKELSQIAWARLGVIVVNALAWGLLLARACK